MTISQTSALPGRPATRALGLLLLLALAGGCGPSTWMATSPRPPWMRGANNGFMQRVESDPFPTASQSGLKDDADGDSEPAVASDE